MLSARCLMMFNICVKFHENMSSGFKVMEPIQKLLTDTHTHTEKRRKLYTPMAYFHGILRMPGYKNVAAAIFVGALRVHRTISLRILMRCLIIMFSFKKKQEKTPRIILKMPYMCQ